MLSRYLILATLGAAFAARADDSAKAPMAPQASTRADDSAKATPASAGLRVYLDPDTGRREDKPRTAAHRAIADDLPRRDDNRMQKVVVPGVGVMMKAQGQLQMTEFVHRDADGKLSSDCVPSARPAPAGGSR